MSGVTTVSLLVVLFVGTIIGALVGMLLGNSIPPDTPLARA